MGITRCLGEMEKITDNVSGMLRRASKEKPWERLSAEDEKKTYSQIKGSVLRSISNYCCNKEEKSELSERLARIEFKIRENNEYDVIDIGNKQVMVVPPLSILEDITNTLDKKADEKVVRAYINTCYELKNEKKKYGAYITICNDLIELFKVYLDVIGLKDIEKTKGDIAGEIKTCGNTIKNAEDKELETLVGKIVENYF